MRKCLWVVFLLVAVLFSSMATAETIVVRAGDNLTRVAQKNGTTLGSLKLANPQIKNPNHILVGQVINLPSGQKNVQNRKIGKGLVAIKELALLKIHDTRTISDGSVPLLKDQAPNSTSPSFKKESKEPLCPTYPVFRYKILPPKT